jgi:hypothetical protein
VNIIEKQHGRDTGYIPPESYPVEIAKVITMRLGIDPDDVASYLQIFFDRSAELQRAYRFDQMPPLAAQLELDLRQAKLGLERPDEGRQQNLRAQISKACADLRWHQVETEELLRVSDPSLIVSITWRGAETNDGRTLTREALRERTRTAAYSDDGWRRYLATLPRIEAPERFTEHEQSN